MSHSEHLMPKDLPSPPFIILPGIPNLRDIGGYPITPFGTRRSVRTKLVYRSADPSGAAAFPASCEALRSTLGIGALFDLRSSVEVTQKALGPPLSLPDITRRHAPTNECTSIEESTLRYRRYANGSREGFLLSYADILVSGASAIGQILRELLKSPNTPLLYHCSAGKDRTGIVTMLLLSLAGVEDDIVANEYALTTEGLGNLRPLIIQHLMKKLGIDHDMADEMTQSPADIMCETLAMLKQNHGGAYGYIQHECRLSVEEVNDLRMILTSDEESSVPNTKTDVS